MHWTPERLLIIGLAVLLLIAILIILKMFRSGKPSRQGSEDPNDYVSQDKHKEVLRERDKYRALYEKSGGKEFSPVFNELQEQYEIACVKIGTLKREKDDLRREINELKKLLDSNPESKNEERKNEEGCYSTISQSSDEELSKKIDDNIIMYASFPRSAGSTIYFSDLTDRLADDSYFELKISNDTGKATFRPLDFMKIRNYDPAMAAILTDGVKPNVASTVVGVELGEAMLEGNDWIIKRLVKIKLA